MSTLEQLLDRVMIPAPSAASVAAREAAIREGWQAA